MWYHQIYGFSFMTGPILNTSINAYIKYFLDSIQNIFEYRMTETKILDAVFNCI